MGRVFWISMFLDLAILKIHIAHVWALYYILNKSGQESMETFNKHHEYTLQLIKTKQNGSVYLIARGLLFFPRSFADLQNY